MNSTISSEADEDYRMVAVKVFTDHRQMEQGIEFRIDPAFYEETIVLLDKLAKKIKDTTQAEDGESENCEYGYENCDIDDPESMCEQHCIEAAERRSEGMQETYDL